MWKAIIIAGIVLAVVVTASMTFGKNILPKNKKDKDKH